MLEVSLFHDNKGNPMKRFLVFTACALALPGAALAATRAYTTEAFNAVSVAAGISVDITTGPTRSVVAENAEDDFGELRIEVKDNVLQIYRGSNSWFSFGRGPKYQVRVVTPLLRSLVASSGAEASAKGVLDGDITVKSSSGSDVDVVGVKGGKVIAQASSGSEIEISGSCVSLEAHASSGSDLDAEELRCERVSLHASSGSELSIAASSSVTGEASSGANIRVRGKPSTVQVDTSSGAQVKVKE
jgi:hypothetical protein